MATNKEKYPDLWAQSERLKSEKAAIQERSAGLRSEREALRQKVAPLEAEMRDLDKQIKAIEGPRLFDIDNQIAALARAMGARSVAHEGSKE
jgi:hypothetical protein